ncbi:hypothetical protein ACOPJQ_02850 [Luteimonas dalianensis]|uniref:hypothetical protein n=1 Tax=Luteimonas dalianensis TaxID=1148196 RepID=UPI003BF1A0DC
MKFASSLLFAAIAATAFSANAQDDAVTVRVDAGNVMASEGGEFVTVASGASLAPGSRIMLAENSSASVVYANGCTASISAAGVHAVPAVCQAGSQNQAAVGTTTAAGIDWASAGWLFLGTAAVAAGLSQMDDGDPLPPPPPVSR